MRRTLVLVPDLVGLPGGDSVLRQRLPALAAMAEFGRLMKLAPLPPVETPEALWLGLEPTEVHLRQGPLTVSALGADPPDRSVHFHLSLMSFADGVLTSPGYVPTIEEMHAISPHLQRLNTSAMTLLEGEGLDHGLVWEGMGEFDTKGLQAVEGQQMRTVLPEGDAEKLLRRLIDDSVNLLSGLELNQRRIDEDLPPYNVLWPWGEGVRKKVPNLLLRRGERATVESGSMRMEGLVRLTSYLHGDRKKFGNGLNTRLKALAERALKRELSIIVLDAPAEMRSKGQMEELEWFARELDTELLQPLLDDALREEARVTVVCPSALGEGLAVTVQPSISSDNQIPFDERALEERTLSRRDVWSVVESGLGL